MSRPLRIEYPDAWYHVMNRGRRAENIFLTDGDRKMFINVLRETIDNYNLRISAYCLMSNHYHLLVQTPDGNLSRCMRHINGIYTQRFNRRNQTEGQLFRGRYKAVLIDSDSHLLEVLRYIHRNPLRAGIVSSLKDYTWSSHAGYLSSSKRWTWLHKSNLLTMLSEKKNRQKSLYRDFVSLAEPEEIELFYSLKNLPSILGNTSFKEFVKEQFAHLGFQMEIPGSKILAPSAEEIISAVCHFYKVNDSQLLISKRGTENRPRDIAIYMVRMHCRKTLPAVGRHFKIENYSTVSSVVQRIKEKKNRDKSVQQEIESIAKTLSKSQKRT